MNWRNLDECAAYARLQAIRAPSLKTVLCGPEGIERVRRYCTDAGAGLRYHYAAKTVNEEILTALAALADEQELVAKYDALRAGTQINTGEKRKVLHHLTRLGVQGSSLASLPCEVRDMHAFYTKEYERVCAFARQVHEGGLRTSRGAPFTDVVQIGIGGSDLGPRALYLALEGWAQRHQAVKMRAHFISNVDPDDAALVLSKLPLETTLFILVSKSGTTLETLSNELFVAHVLRQAGLEPHTQFVAVTSETSPLANNPQYLASFYMDDFIGGRYSSSSVCGAVVLTLAFGPQVFGHFLSGAAEADRAAQEQDIRRNAALLDALIGVYERTILGHEHTAVLPYSQALARFPAHLQQLDMESNGKSVNRFGIPITYKTGPVIFGEPGTNGQHSFYQHLHQGTSVVPLQFIAFQHSQLGQDPIIRGSTGQQKLLANVVAQIVAFARGKEHADANKTFSGERPSSLLYAKALTPQTLGALLAHFENKIMFQGFAWNLNSFDQEGVQLGKTLAQHILAGEVEGVLRAYADLFDLAHAPTC
ncbi:glucose-6-phosphate isomerase [Treponema paraluiscuniculi Cuniculi A]|uniref:Glucose-6-phosphate isomerase n=2 Tax=Treponema paraluiscuniculi TaxID=53435 RepID=F7XST1_TREPU|nr:glucose-6-phosphate isomerase [Treponema paraluiscuniculi]AEH40414.1 glucose-6-phosphate isomerase [Treponema paraluiscuniculi Cuniculi A]WKC72342.1 glucose-6-phosphate isomerase [Treponema paraluiscuniculi]